jgi:cytochrome bd-type quinol oxidase subunit 2
MSLRNQVSFFARNAWKVIFVLYILILVLGVGEFRRGQSGDPGMVEAVSGISWEQLKTSNPEMADLLDVETRIIGSLWVGLGLIGAAVSLTGFKRGEKWAWWSTWSLPIVMALILGIFLNAKLVSEAPTPPALFSAPITITISGLALLLCIRKFFPKIVSGGKSQN